MSKIFVAGATGNIGTALLAELHDANVGVVAGVHDPDKAKTLEELGVETRRFEFQDQPTMAKAMKGCDRLFLVLPLEERMARYGHLAVQAAKEAGIEYIVRSSGYASSSDAHWRLGREQGMVDQFVEDSGIPFTILRPNSFMQNFSTTLAPMVRSGVITLPDEDFSVSYIDVRDIAACAARVLLDSAGFEKGFYALTGPQGLTLTDVAAQIQEATGGEVRYSPIAEEDYVAILKEAEVPDWNINMLVSLVRVIKLGMMGNVTKAVEHIPGRPARTFSGFAVEHAPVWL